MTETIRVLIPDHLDLAGQLGSAVEFGASLHHANDPDVEDGSEPWRLPEQLIAPELEDALDAIVLHDWHHDVGDTAAEADTAISVTHADYGHMGLYVATATRTQLSLLTAALDMLIQTEATPPSERLPQVREIAEFVEAWREADESGEYDASLSAWQTVVRVLTLANAPAPTSTSDRPSKLYDAQGILVSVADAAGTSPATDTALLLDRINAGDGRSVDLDDEAWRAWQRLSAEWHAAIYRARSNDPNALLASYTY